MPKSGSQSSPPFPPRHAESIQEQSAVSGATNKTLHTVTAGKNFFVDSWWVSVSEGKKLIFELQDDTVEVASLGSGEDGNTGGTMLLPQFNPLGPFAAGSVVRVARVEGDSGKDWSCGLTGYEEDE